MIKDFRLPLTPCTLLTEMLFVELVRDIYRSKEVSLSLKNIGSEFIIAEKFDKYNFTQLRGVIELLYKAMGGTGIVS